MTTPLQERSTTDIYQHELATVFNKAGGPVADFSPEATHDLELKTQAVATGDIPHGAFANLPVFEFGEVAMEKKYRRYAVKTGAGALRILIERDREQHLTPYQKAIRTAAEMHAEQQLNHAVIVEAARKLHNEPGGPHAALYYRELQRAQNDLYPKPDQRIANMVLGRLGASLRETDPADLPEGQARFLEQFRSAYPQVLERREAAPVPELPTERVAEFHDALHIRFGAAMQAAHEAVGDREFDPDVAVDAMNAFLRANGMPMAESPDDFSGWLCVRDTSAAGFKTSPNERRILCGRFTKLTWRRFEQLAMHEAVVHAFRSEQGAKTGVDALRIGLPGNADFEEGMGILFEQLWSGKIKTELARDDFRYLSICYAEGLVDGEKHNETETLRFTSSFIAAADICKGTPKSVDALITQRRGTSYDHVKRAFRGMPDGVVLHGNLAYLQGKLDAIELIKNSTASAEEVIDFLLQGKSNPLDRRHTKVLSDLGMRATIR